MRTHTFAFLIAAVHLALAVFYCQVTPYRTAGQLLSSWTAPGIHARTNDIGAPDERQHANYVQHLLDGKGFPVFKAGDGEQYEAHQPPAYYVLTAGFARLLGVTDVGQKTAIRLRWLNALIGAGTVLGVYFLALWGFGRKDVALVGATFAAVLPMLCALDGAVSNDPLLFLTFTWCLALLARGIVSGWSWKLAVGVGLLMGVAFLTKTTSLALVPTVACAGFLGKKAPARFLWCALAIALVMALPWWLRNKELYGDLFALSAFNAGFNNPHPADIIPGLPGGALEYWTNWFGWWTIRSFFGAFGYMDIFMNSSGVPMPPTSAGDHEVMYRLLTAGFIFLAAGWALSLRQPEARAYGPVHVLNGLFLFLVFALFLRFNLTFFQAQGRYLIPAIGPIACGIGFGLCHWSGKKWTAGLAMLAIVLIAVNVAVLSWLPEEFAKRTLTAVRRPNFD